MTTITELQSTRHPWQRCRPCPSYTDLVEVARLLPLHRAGILLCDETHVHVYTTAGTFKVSWIDCEDGSPNHAAMAAVIEARLAGHATRRAELAAELAAARRDLQHAPTETWKRSARRAIEMIEAEIEELG